MGKAGISVRLVRACRWLAMAGSLVVAFAVRAEEAPDFHLDLDTGGHSAQVTDLAFTPDGEDLVSASDDKTIRIWDWQSGVTLRTIRGYLGNGSDGKIFAVAVSPDGKTIAAGGYFGASLGDKPPYGDIRLFDFATGKMKAVLKAADYATYDLAFSPDGKTLAAGGADGFVYLWRLDDKSATGWTLDKKLDADSWHIDKLAFAAAGTRLAVTTTDNGIRLWDVVKGEEIALPAEAEPLRDISVMALSASQDGSLFATGDKDGLVQLWHAADGSLVRALPKQDFLVGSLTFAKGSRLVVSCGYRCADKHRSTVWNTDTGEKALDYSGHDGTVRASAANADGSLVATAGGTRNAIQVWDPATGERKALLQGLGEPVTSVGFDAANGIIAWGNANTCPDRVACPEQQGALDKKLELPTTERFFDDPQPLAESGPFARAALADAQWSLHATTGGKDALENAVLEIANGGKVVRSIENDATNGFVHSAYTLIDNGLGVITGGNDGTLLEYRTATAKVSGEFTGHTGEINAMVAAEKAGLLVTGSADQTLRLWNLKTHELIVSMFFAGSQWIAWMPQGYYYSSDEGDKLIGWQVNQGRDHEGRFIRAGQLKKYLWSPEMVRRAIILRSARQAVKEMRPGVDNELQKLLQRKPPEFGIRLADDQSKVRDGYVAVEISGAKEAGTDVAGFSILSNSRNVGDVTARSVDGNSAIVEVPVENGQNTIRITGTNEYGYLTERSVTALARKTEKAEAKGKLYVAVIGVDKYPFLTDACSGHACDLRYPVDDATEFLKVIAQKSAPLFSSMESLVLVNREALDEAPDKAKQTYTIASADGVMEPDSHTIDDQLADFLDRPGEHDTTIIFVAGHGINIDEDYYFIPTDGRKQDAERWKRSSLVDWSDIQKSVERAKGMRFMLLDTCHAANAFNPRLEKDAQDARIVVFSATAANNTAAELPELGHGVFTYSILEGLRGKARTSDGGVTLFGLADFISREVVRLTSSRQKPFYYVGGVENIVLAEP
ncbi:caspase family protein [Mesorhizobium qingshengii]|uniref:WD-40 repeat-containing protein n=1 Tax=Mesorhizobium qingshengii TaxID=1165689 RepID=A0A1G5ZF65_9HYPH|nr:caspase family protein [Mesorhizobium qingshengii]SDA93195.1 WD-40 repeat-containing protein [Mesorhizobium qingshengii]